MTERDAEFLQVGAVQVREGAKVDVILGKDLAVFAQTETVQPILNQWHARLRFRQFASTENLGFASSTIRACSNGEVYQIPVGLSGFSLARVFRRYKLRSRDVLEIPVASHQVQRSRPGSGVSA
jgi:hypothetical protein